VGKTRGQRLLACQAPKVICSKAHYHIPFAVNVALEQAWSILKVSPAPSHNSSYPEHMDYEGRGNTCHACGRTCNCPATDWISELHPDNQHTIRQIKTRGGLTPKGGAGIFTLRENDGQYGTEYGSGPEGQVTEEDLIVSGRGWQQ